MTPIFHCASVRKSKVIGMLLFTVNTLGIMLINFLLAFDWLISCFPLTVFPRRTNFKDYFWHFQTRHKCTEVKINDYMICRKWHFLIVNDYQNCGYIHPTKQMTITGKWHGCHFKKHTFVVSWLTSILFKVIKAPLMEN